MGPVCLCSTYFIFAYSIARFDWEIFNSSNKIMFGFWINTLCYQSRLFTLLSNSFIDKFVGHQNQNVQKLKSINISYYNIFRFADNYFPRNTFFDYWTGVTIFQERLFGISPNRRYHPPPPPALRANIWVYLLDLILSIDWYFRITRLSISFNFWIFKFLIKLTSYFYLNIKVCLFIE